MGTSRGRRILEGGEQRHEEGVPEGGQARSMEVILKVGGAQPGGGGLRSSPGQSGWKTPGCSLFLEPSGGSSLSLVL